MTKQSRRWGYPDPWCPHLLGSNLNTSYTKNFMFALLEHWPWVCLIPSFDALLEYTCMSLFVPLLYFRRMEYVFLISYKESQLSLPSVSETLDFFFKQNFRDLSCK